MKIFSLCFALVLAGANLAHAQTAAAPAAAPAGLYAALGEKAGIDRLADDFVERLLRHPRIGPQFKDTKPAAFKESLAEQFCVLSGGPCSYQGADMREVHAETEFSGSLLRQIREVQGVSLAEIAQKTKISTTHLLAIEEERASDLPAMVYGQGCRRRLGSPRWPRCCRRRRARPIG